MEQPGIRINELDPNTTPALTDLVPSQKADGSDVKTTLQQIIKAGINDNNTTSTDTALSAKKTTDLIGESASLSEKENIIPYPYYQALPSITNGITYTAGDSGELIANGTATANAWVQIAKYEDAVKYRGRKLGLYIENYQTLKQLGVIAQFYSVDSSGTNNLLCDLKTSSVENFSFVKIPDDAVTYLVQIAVTKNHTVSDLSIKCKLFDADHSPFYTEYPKKMGVVGVTATTGGGWFKFGSVTMSSIYKSCSALIRLTSTDVTTGAAYGVMLVKLRQESPVTNHANTGIYWVERSSLINNSDFMVVAKENGSDVTYDLWVKSTASYRRLRFTLLEVHTNVNQNFFKDDSNLVKLYTNVNNGITETPTGNLAQTSTDEYMVNNIDDGVSSGKKKTYSIDKIISLSPTCITLSKGSTANFALPSTNAGATIIIHRSNIYILAVTDYWLAGWIKLVNNNDADIVFTKSANSTGFTLTNNTNGAVTIEVLNAHLVS